MLRLKPYLFPFLLVNFFNTNASDKKIAVPEQQQYLIHINQARLYAVDSLYQKACDEYEIAFSYRKDYVIDLLECAKMYDKLNDTKNTLKYLKRSIEAGCDWYNDGGLLTNLKRTNRFPSPSQLEQYRRVYYQKLNIDYLLQLEKLVGIDQSIRDISDYAQLTDANAENELLRIIDSTNMPALKGLVEKYGYPEYGTVGYQGETDAFILLLHGLHGIQKDLNWAYFQPIILKKVRDGSLMPEHYAFLYDRVISNLGSAKQCYGTQWIVKAKGSYELRPIEDVENVDVRRREIGLMPLGDWLKIAGMKAPDGYIRK